MVKKAERIVYLIKRHLSGDITSSEQMELDHWLNASAANRRLLDEQRSDLAIEDYMKAYNEVDTAAGWKRIVRGIRPSKLRVIAPRLYAAAIMALIALTTVIYLQNSFYNRHFTEVTDKDLQFQQDNLERVLRKMAAENNVALDLQVAPEKNIELTGYITQTNDIPAMISVLEYLFENLRIEYDGKKISVKRA